MQFPTDVLYLILSYLNLPDLLFAARVCHIWKLAARKILDKADVSLELFDELFTKYEGCLFGNPQITIHKTFEMSFAHYECEDQMLYTYNLSSNSIILSNREGKIDMNVYAGLESCDICDISNIIELFVKYLKVCAHFANIPKKNLVSKYKGYQIAIRTNINIILDRL